MAIFLFPKDSNFNNVGNCVACDKRIRTEQASAGMQDIDGFQMFVCDQHYKSNRHLNCWVDFSLWQRQLLEQTATELFFSGVFA